MELQKLRNGIYATAMNMRIMRAYEDMENEDLAEQMLSTWLSYGVPDGNELEDNIECFGNNKDYDDLCIEYFELCEGFELNPNFSKEIEEIKKNIVEMLDNPYYNMI